MSRFCAFGTIGFLAAMMVLPQSYLVIKLGFLAVFLTAHLIQALSRGQLVIHGYSAMFYGALILIGLVWSVIGLAHQNSPAGVVATLRLYGLWSLAFLLIVTLLRNHDPVETIHRAIVLAGIAVSLINFAGLADSYYQLGAIPEPVRRELGLYLNFGEGYIKIQSNNIASLFFIAPYLVAIRMHRGARQLGGSSLTTFAMVLCLGAAVLSGRRALWLCIAFTPLLVLGLAWVSGALRQMTGKARVFIALYIAGAPVGALLVLAIMQQASGGLVEYFSEAFSGVDERSIQKGYLIAGFLQHLTIGSGFGASAGYLRSQEAPWLYELTYHQMLFNFGLLGVLIMLAGLAYYSYLAIEAIRDNGGASAAPFGILVGLYAILVGAYSNPYFGYFDALIYVGLLVYLSSLHAGSPQAKIGFTWHQPVVT